MARGVCLDVTLTADCLKFVMLRKTTVPYCFEEKNQEKIKIC
jgi:hypothetical protein